MYRIPSTLNGDLDYTQSLIDQFKAGEIQAGQLKSNRMPMGIYVSPSQFEGNFISLCHTDEILDYVLKSIEESIE